MLLPLWSRSADALDRRSLIHKAQHGEDWDQWLLSMQLEHQILSKGLMVLTIRPSFEAIEVARMLFKHID